ncbi:MAG: cytochrome c [Chitinophagaceae bacterium]|nr:MAG: cytochrome c [Chitinophagaceae bacterium]
MQQKKVRMKKSAIIFSFFIIVITVLRCSSDKREPGTAYMPDMVYSRAYETYASVDNLHEKGVNYNSTPVAGTVARGDLSSYPYKNDSIGYVLSKNVKNPLPTLDAKDYIEATRLFLVNCGICHGDKLDGNGPLWKDGDGPFPSAPRNLLKDPVTANMAEGTMFHSMTYGKNMMGSYASQLSTKQRWMIVHYIKEKQRLSKTGETVK